MSGKRTLKYPSNEKLIELIHKHDGNVRAAADEVKLNETSLRRYIQGNAALTKELKAIRSSSHSWPSNEGLIQVIREAGGKVAHAAGVLGVDDRTLRSRIKRQGLDGQVDGIRAEHRRVVKPTAVPTPEQIEDGPSEEEILRQQVAELNASLRAASKISVIEERALRRMDDAIEVIKPKYKPAPKRRLRAADDRHEFVLLMSDTHAGEIVSETETLGMNFYDWDTMLTRMQKIQSSVLSYQAHRPYPVGTLHISFLGDMLSGSIHEELARTNQMTDAEAVVQFAYDAAKWLEAFTPHFEKINVAGVPGNHPRRSQKPAAKQAFNNDDWLTYKAIEMLLRDHDNFSFDFPKADFAAITVVDRWRALLMHGDGIRSSMPGVPWGGVVRRVTTLEQQFAAARQPLDYVFMGHFHTRNMLDGVGVETILNGSVKGLDEYSLKKFGSGRRPSQVLLTFHERKGLTDVSRIDLIDPIPAAAAA